MTHGEEEAQTKEEKRAVSPSTTHIRLYIFFSFYILGEGGEIEGNDMRKIMKELCPNTTHGEEAQTEKRASQHIELQKDRWYRNME